METQGISFKKKHNFSLFQAARDGQVEIVSQHIYAIGKDKKKLNRKDQDQTTALHYAVRYGHYNIVKMLVENGASMFLLIVSHRDHPFSTYTKFSRKLTSLIPIMEKLQ